MMNKTEWWSNSSTWGAKRDASVQQREIEKCIPFYRSLPKGSVIKVLKPRTRSHSSGFFAGVKGNYIRVRFETWNGYKIVNEVWKYHVLDVSCDAIKLMEAL